MKKPSVKDLQGQIVDLENKWKRALADYQNLEKRALADRQVFVKIANLGLVAKLIPILDDLERAAEHLKDTGLNLVVKQFQTSLKEEGVESIDPTGQEFDPATMECIDKVLGEENKVLTVGVKGYRMGETIVRPAKVTVGSVNK